VMVDSVVGMVISSSWSLVTAGRQRCVRAG
jgi:hypothetical protein